MKRIIFSPAVMFVIGLAAGAASRWLDLNTQNLGNMFSQLPVWILIGVFVTLESENRLCACLNVLSLCIAMLITYYYVMLKYSGIYAPSIIFGWTAFALCSPIMAFVVYYVKYGGIIGKTVSVLIISVSCAAGVILYGGPRVYDVIIDILLVFLLFSKGGKTLQNEYRCQKSIEKSGK